MIKFLSLHHPKENCLEDMEFFPELTNALIVMHSQPTIEDVNDNMAVIERFVCLMYHSATSRIEVNKCCRHLFTKKGRPLEGLPPTAEALHQHTLRAVYRGGFVWAQALAAIQNLPKPEQWGWMQEENIYGLRYGVPCQV